MWRIKSPAHRYAVTLLTTQQALLQFTDLAELPKKLADALNNASDAIKDSTHVDMYLLKQTQSKFPDKRFELKTIDIVDDIPKAFRQVAKRKLSKVSKNIAAGLVKIRGFYEMKYSKGDFTFLEAEKIPVFPHIKKSIKEHTNLHPLSDLSEVKQFHSFAIRFCTEGGDIIYFRRMRKYQLVSQYYGITGFLHKGKFNKVKDDILAFDEVVDCIYFEEADAVLILDKGMTENIFNFKDAYATHTKEVFETLDKQNIATIDKKLLDKVIGSKQITRRITAMLKENKFNRPMKFYLDHQQLFKSDPNKYKRELATFHIINNKVSLTNQEELETFLGVCTDAYVKGIVSGVDYFAPDKEELGK